MNTSYENIEKQLKDYIDYYSKKENNILYYLPIFLSLALNIIAELRYTSSLKDENIKYYTQINEIDKFKLIKTFHKIMCITFDIDEIIKQKKIIFEDNNSNRLSEFLHQGKFLFNNKNQTKIVVPNNGLIIDIPIIIHEISHYIDYLEYNYTTNYNNSKDLLTESTAYSYEFICLNYLSNIGYKKDSYNFLKYIYKNIYNLSNKIIPLMKIILAYQDCNNITSKDFRKHFYNQQNYKNHIKYLKVIIDKNINIIDCCHYILGICIATYTLDNYLNNTEYKNNLLRLYDSNINLNDYLDIIGLYDLGHTDRKILKKSINRISSIIN